jgi:hypothetical protein
VTASEKAPKGEGAATQEIFTALHDLFNALGDAIPALSGERLEKLQPKLAQAKMLGQLAVAYSNFELKQRVKGLLDALAPDAAPSSPSTQADAAAPQQAPEAPLDGYDEMTAAAIVKVLPTLDAATLEAVIAHEEAGRSRATVLGRARQLLQAASPA